VLRGGETRVLGEAKDSGDSGGADVVMAEGITAVLLMLLQLSIELRRVGGEGHLLPLLGDLEFRLRAFFSDRNGDLFWAWGGEGVLGGADSEMGGFSSRFGIIVSGSVSYCMSDVA